MQKFDVIWSAKFGNLYLVIFCRPFIQLLGNLEELKNKKYATTMRQSMDLKQPDHKIGRMTEVTKISNYFCFMFWNFTGLLFIAEVTDQEHAEKSDKL